MERIKKSTVVTLKAYGSMVWGWLSEDCLWETLEFFQHTNLYLNKAKKKLYPWLLDSKSLGFIICINLKEGALNEDNAVSSHKLGVIKIHNYI